MGLNTGQIGIDSYIQLTDADYTVLTENSGIPHFIPNVSADRTITLPEPVKGLNYEFLTDMIAADGHDWIFDTQSTTNYFVGGLLFADTDAGTGAAEVALNSGDGNSNKLLQVNLPAPGTWVKFICDGTLWHVRGVAVSTTAPTWADS